MSFPVHYYVVYRPSLRVIFTSLDRNECEEEFKKIGRDYDEDYVVTNCFEFLDFCKDILPLRISVPALATYVDLVERHGVNSSQAVEFKEKHKDDTAFMQLLQTVDEVETLQSSTILTSWILGGVWLVTAVVIAVLGLFVIPLNLP